MIGIYTASKFAVEGFSESLAAEVKGFGVNVTLLEPNSYAAEWVGASAVQAATPLREYDVIRMSIAGILYSHTLTPC